MTAYDEHIMRAMQVVVRHPLDLTVDFEKESLSGSANLI